MAHRLRHRRGGELRISRVVDAMSHVILYHTIPHTMAYFIVGRPIRFRLDSTRTACSLGSPRTLCREGGCEREVRSRGDVARRLSPDRRERTPVATYGTTTLLYGVRALCVSGRVESSEGNS